jgi:hypothetical protein
MIRPEDLEPLTRSRVDTARARFTSDAERMRAAMQNAGASDEEAATVLLSGLASAMAGVMAALVPPHQRAETVRTLSAALHVNLMKEGN